ncbi:pyruvate kinase [Lacrimispora sp. 210928-DFI.3.58]|uniref:pyruvate kinase n=1 Tax=Lacrimispora sp. 210928-DFI.3.58 TaxID=2883214 RepID=UPI0015B518F0|nr:pyruvate kinase [Lacrimispora sp. 210928-DFI.3.58]MCB7321170.1 pyruvate kinase [Lacrimispora sp. 210928-DFI.3.58]
MKRTKIICTMGPNTSDKNMMAELAKNGMDVARFNFSHGDYSEHLGRLEMLKEVRKELDIPVAALLDTKGPEIRTGVLKDGKKVTLKEGQTYTLTTREVTGDENVGHINYSGLNEDVVSGNRILIDDGLIELRVEEVKDTDIVCTVVNGGELGERKGVNVPNVKIKLPALTDKDKEDIRFGIKHGFDFIAASFVRTADCIREIKEMLDEQGSSMKVIAKIENAEGIENLDAIIEAADGIMVARGDMGVEIPAEQVPHIQKQIIRKCNEACKTVITATQMLDSMIRNPRPTRAEVTDVANAIYDGTDAVMLSGETAMGKYPVEALKMMASIAEETESHLDYTNYRERKVSKQNMKNISNAVCFSSVSTAHDVGADAIVAPSISGFTSMLLSKWRPAARIIGMSPSMATVRQMQLQWGVTPVWSRRAESTDELIENSTEELKEKGLVHPGELAVITAGVVTYTRRHEPATQTNIMRVISIE